MLINGVGFHVGRDQQHSAMGRDIMQVWSKNTNSVELLAFVDPCQRPKRRLRRTNLTLENWQRMHEPAAADHGLLHVEQGSTNTACHVSPRTVAAEALASVARAESRAADSPDATGLMFHHSPHTNVSGSPAGTTAYLIPPAIRRRF